MSYRPEGWTAILRKKTDEWNANPPEWTFDNFIEFGADAMLEGLKKQAMIPGDIVRNMQSTSAKWYDAVTCLQKGNWYFIPEEAE